MHRETFENIESNCYRDVEIVRNSAALTRARPSPRGERLASVDDAERLRDRLREDEKLLRGAEKALTEIKVAQGLSDRHAAVLAALRIRLKGKVDSSLDEMLEAADDAEDGGSKLDELMREKRPEKSLDDLFAEQPEKPEWPS